MKRNDTPKATERWTATLVYLTEQNPTAALVYRTEQNPTAALRL